MVNILFFYFIAGKIGAIRITKISTINDIAGGRIGLNIIKKIAITTITKIWCPSNVSLSGIGIT
ncbi:MAG: hypothetical protein V3S42_02515 [Candidatus Neomarinimicrobiota bacterium]